MANISQVEMQKFETLLAMDGGYVLNFSNQNFERFIKSTIKIDIDINSVKYQLYGVSKAKRLRALWELENDHIVGKVLEELVAYYQAQVDLGKPEVKKVNDKVVEDCLRVAYRLQEKQFKEVKESKPINFDNKDVDEIPLSQLSLPGFIIPILEQRILEIKKCLQVQASLSVLFLSGSVLEGILLNIATQNPMVFNKSNSSPKDKAGKVKPFPEWSLNSLIEVAYDLGFLGLDVKKHSHSLRDFRNYIHPFEQMSSGFTPDSHTAEIGWKVLKAAMHDLYSKMR